MSLRPPFRLYVSAVSVVGSACLAFVLVHSTPDAIDHAPRLLWIFFGCVLVAELLPINVVIRGQEGELLTSTAFAFGTMIAFGPGAAVPALCIGSALGDIGRRKPLNRTLFNVGQYAISLTVTGYLMEAVTAVPRHGEKFAFVPA